MRLSILFAFVALWGVALAGSNEAWGVSRPGNSQPLDTVKPQKSVDGVVEDYQIVQNREQWEILKTKQQKLRTAKVQLEALIKKHEAKSGRPYPKTDIINDIEHMMNYRPSDPLILGLDADHLPLSRKSSSRSSTPRSGSYSSLDHLLDSGFSDQAYGAKTNSPPASSVGSTGYGAGYGVQDQANGAKTNSPLAISLGSSGYGAGYGVQNQAYGGPSPQNFASSGSYNNQVPVSRTGVYSPQSTTGTGSYRGQIPVSQGAASTNSYQVPVSRTGVYSPQSTIGTGSYRGQIPVSQGAASSFQVPVTKIQTGIYSPGMQNAYAQNRYSDQPTSYVVGRSYPGGIGIGI